MTTRPTTRRAALGSVAGGLAGLAGLSACDDVGRPGATSPSRTPASPSASADPDEDLVDDAVRELRQALRRARAAKPSPARSRLVEMHEAHLHALEATPGHGKGRRPSDQELRSVEQRLQRRLAELAVEADSGALARLLASMSAGTAVHLASLRSGRDADSEGGA